MKLAGWKKRIRLDIDYTNKIGGSVTQFPVTIFLKPTNGDTWKVFNEVGNNYRKIAITKADGVTELKVEMELWDVANKVGVLHTSLANWVIGGDTCIYLYYDGSHYDNPNVGNIASDAGKAVWDSNFKMVQHMVDYDTSHIKDSTSNGYNGTKGSAGNPTEADGKIAKGQNYDANTETIELGNVLGWERTQSVTIEAWGKHTTTDKYSQILSKQLSSSSHQGWSLYKGNKGSDGHKLVWVIVNTWTSNAIVKRGSTALNDNTWHYLVGTYDGSSSANGAKLYVDCVEESYTTIHNSLTASILTSATASIGNRDTPATLNQGWEGTLDEVRISYVVRSSAWIKASYNSLNDTLLKYLKEETLFSRRGIFYVPINTSNFFHFFR